MISNNDNNIQNTFIAVCISKWHLNNLISILLQGKFKKGKLYILPQKNILDGSKYRISKDDLLQYSSFFEDIIFCDQIKSNYKILLFNILNSSILGRRWEKEFFHIFNPGGINFKLYGITKINRKIIFNELDEGTASYVNPVDHVKIADKTNSKHLNYNKVKTKLWVKKTLIFVCYNLLKIKKENYFLFLKKGTNLIPNLKVANGLNTFYTNKEKATIENSEKSILILKDFDEKILPYHIILEVYVNLLKQCSMDIYQIYIKRHPNDVDEKFEMDIKSVFKKCKFLDNSRDAETIVNVLKPSFVIGGISTSTFTIPYIFDTPTISILKIYNQYLGLDIDYKERFQVFISFFDKSEIIFIEKIEELKELIKK